MEAKLRIIDEMDIRKYSMVNTPFKSVPTLSEWLSYWLESCIKDTCKPSTYANYRSYIEAHITPLLGDYCLNELSNPIIQTYVCLKLKGGRLDKKGGLSIKTVKEHISVLKLAFKKAVELNIIQLSPYTCVTYPKEIREEIKVLSINEQKQINNAVEHTYKENSMIPIFLGMFAGLRIGEVSALRIHNIDFENRVIHICESLNRVAIYNRDGSIQRPLVYNTTKSNKIRVVPMNDDIYVALRTYINTMPDEIKENKKSPLFLNSKGKVMEPRTINYHFQNFLRKMNINNIHFHSLRHTFATRALETGMNIKYCSAILGHASTTITENLYSHVTQIQLQKEIKKLSMSSIGL